MSLRELDQAEWQLLTAWKEALPSYGSTWALLTDPQLPHNFRNLVLNLKHPVLRKLRQEAEAAFEISEPPTMERASTWNNRFANLVSGRFTEKLFHETYGATLERLGLRLTETTAEHDWLDYLITEPSTDFILGINVKNAGVQFRLSTDRVGLSPDDTLPIATYKIFGSTKKEGHTRLIYVYLVDWTLLPKLRIAFWSSLNDAEQKVFRLMTSFRSIPRKLEDCFVECTVSDRLPTLYEGVGYTQDKLTQLPFQAISGRRCQRIFYNNHERAPYVYVQKMNTDPNVHVSVGTETTHFEVLIDQWLSSPESRSELMRGLDRTESFEIPDPPV
jgi:hypothetical protein